MNMLLYLYLLHKNFFNNRSIRLLPIKPNPPVTITFSFFDFMLKIVSIAEYTYIMSISRQNLSVIIVSFKSNHVIEHCIESLLIKK